MLDNETIEVMLMSLLYLSFKCMTHFSLPFIYPFFSIFLAGFSLLHFHWLLFLLHFQFALHCFQCRIYLVSYTKHEAQKVSKAP